VYQRLRPHLSKENNDDLVRLKAFIGSGKVIPVIDGTYPLRNSAEALAYVSGGSRSEKSRRNRVTRDIESLRGRLNSSLLVGSRKESLGETRVENPSRALACRWQPTGFSLSQADQRMRNP
jgi:hypothetical protein